MDTEVAAQFDLVVKEAVEAGIKRRAKKNADLPITLVPLTESEWANMDGKARWDSIVALRGPDLVRSESLKWWTTSVIRYRLSAIMRVGGLVNRAVPFVVLPNSLSLRRGEFDGSHFIGHVFEASEWLRIKRLTVPDEVFSKLTSTRATAGYQILIDWIEALGDDKKAFEPFLITLKSVMKQEAW